MCKGCFKPGTLRITVVTYYIQTRTMHHCYKIIDAGLVPSIRHRGLDHNKGVLLPSAEIWCDDDLVLLGPQADELKIIWEPQGGLCDITRQRWVLTSSDRGNQWFTKVPIPMQAACLIYMGFEFLQSGSPDPTNTPEFYLGHQRRSCRRHSE